MEHPARSLESLPLSSAALVFALRAARNLCFARHETKCGLSTVVKFIALWLPMMYEDHIFGRISDDNYHRMLGKYQAEQDQLKKKLEAYDQLKEKSADLRSKAERIADLFEQYGDFEELTSGVLNALIDKITVSEPYVEDGRYKQDLTIYYRFIGAIGTTHYDAHRFYKSEKVKEASDKRAARHRKEREEEIRAEMQKDPVGLLAVQ